MINLLIIVIVYVCGLPEIPAGVQGFQKSTNVSAWHFYILEFTLLIGGGAIVKIVAEKCFVFF